MAHRSDSQVVRVVEGAPASTARPPAPPAITPSFAGLVYTGTEELGRGRSGVVYRGRDAQGRPLACKVFGAHGLTKFVQWIFLGAPNPYQWSQDAVRCAALRREILSALVPIWFDGRLQVADAHGVSWNEEHGAHELATAFVDGRPAFLRHPRRIQGGDEAAELARQLMRPLQQRLIESGFAGLAWQAGKGNPVALNNFLHSALEQDGGHGARSVWVWIDLESGVPNLFPLDPRALFGFYLPLAWRLRRVPFDDVDVERLRAALESKELSSALEESRAQRLAQAVDELELHQTRWKSLRRFEGSIGYRLASGAIDHPTAEWYRTRPIRWYAREAQAALRKAPAKIGGLLRAGFLRLRAIPLVALFRAAGRFLSSQRFRYALARRHVSRRILAWEERGQMERPDADFLRSHLRDEESTSYLTDFGVHLALKPFVKAIEYWLFPALYALGVISEPLLAVALLTGGPAARSLYTGGRLVQSALRGHERPWIALFVGVLPVLGNFAYPFQLVWSSTEERDDLARFMLYDDFARLGAHLPIWGGMDTATEHFMNRLPDRVIRLRRPSV